jgi:hypothetical protein
MASLGSPTTPAHGGSATEDAASLARSACLRSQALRRAPTEASGTYVGRRRVSL